MVNLPLDQCVGCGACANICPKSAITLEYSNTGFIYPRINLSKCIECSACEKVCQVYSSVATKEPHLVLGITSKDEYVANNSSSGGIAFLLSEEFIKQGGVVYGCALLSADDIRHIRVTDTQNLEPLRGSKYVQSDLNNVFTQIKDDLKNGIKVLFIGTPCQVAAVKKYINKPDPNLYTIDLICHGVPSQLIFKSYLKQILTPLNLTFKDVTVKFRWKNNTDNTIEFGFKIYDSSGRLVKTIPSFKNAYMAAFFSGMSFRDNCFNCKFAKANRVGDITLGDFWGISLDKKSQLYGRNGISLILINTEKGDTMRDIIADRTIFETRTIQEAIAHNRNLSRPTEINARRSEFINDCLKNGVELAVRKHIPEYNRERRFSRRLYLKLASKISKTSLYIWIQKKRQ